MLQGAKNICAFKTSQDAEMMHLRHLKRIRKIARFHSVLFVKRKKSYFDEYVSAARGQNTSITPTGGAVNASPNHRPRRSRTKARILFLPTRLRIAIKMMGHKEKSLSHCPKARFGLGRCQGDETDQIKDIFQK